MILENKRDQISHETTPLNITEFTFQGFYMIRKVSDGRREEWYKEGGIG
jgi:hypothetical protein